MTYQKTPKRDFRQEVTDSIIAALEKGVPPWKKSWQSGSLEIPLNPTTGKRYNGGNVLRLMFVGDVKGYADPRWCTFNQARANDWQVRKGEHGSQVEFWKPINLGDDRKDRSRGFAEDDERKRFIHCTYTVFNACQIDGIPAREPKVHNEWEVIQSGESILRNSGAKIIHAEQDRAFYRKSTDTIHLPLKTAFPDAADYLGTALHELSHWSGHMDRLNRETLVKSTHFGDEMYAREELRAELASVFIAAEKGIPYRLDSNAAYIDNWLGVLRNDRNEIFRAASDAQKAADFIVALELHRSLDQALAAVRGIQPEVKQSDVEPVGEAARTVFRSKEYDTQPVEMEM